MNQPNIPKPIIGKDAFIAFSKTSRPNTAPSDQEVSSEAEQIRKQWPTPTELSMLVAAIWREASANDFKRRDCLRKALQLWIECAEHLDYEANRIARIHSLERAAERLDAKIKRPKSFPTNYKAFLKLVVVGKTEAEKLPKLKRFLASLVAVERNTNSSDRFQSGYKLQEVKPGDPRVLEHLKHFQENPISEWDWFQLAHYYNDWQAKESKRQRTSRAQKAANARHGKP